MCEICGGGAVHSTQCPNNPNYYGENHKIICRDCGEEIGVGEQYLKWGDDRFCFECVCHWHYDDWMELLDTKFEEA